MSGAPDNWPLSAREAAALLGVSERTIRRAIARGNLPATRHAGVYRIAHTDLARYRPILVPHETRAPAASLHLVPFPDHDESGRAALPQPRSSLIGREREIAAVRALLLRHDVPIVTLTGPGGVGKTRLALRVAEEMHGEFVDGVAFVPLAPIRDPALVASAIAHGLGVGEAGGRSLLDGLRHYLRERRLLLLLDNFEQVLPAAGLIGELLASAPRLTILVTSRAVLRLTGEHVIPVPPLALLNPGDRVTPEEAARCAAIRLFAERAAAAQAEFRLDEANALAVAEICRRLDGLPLAIELAAARISTLPPTALLGRLERRLPLLTQGARDQPARLQKMRDAIAWSYDLLEERDRTVFCRLSVFAGGFTLDAAEAVVGEDALEGVASLAGTSLLRRMVGARPGNDEEPRFEMLETIREFGLEQLEASGDNDAARDAHAAHFLAVAVRFAPLMLGGNPIAWLDRLAADHDNLRVALDRLGRAETADDCLLLAASCAWYWTRRGHIAEGRMWLGRALALAGPEPTLAKGRALRYAAELAVDAGDLPAAAVFAREGLAVADAVGDPRLRVHTLHAYARTEDARGHWDVAATLYEQELANWRAIGEPRPIAMVLTILGRVTYSLGDLDRARKRVEEAAAIFRDLGDHTWGDDIWVAFADSFLGLFALAQRRFVEAAHRYCTSLRGFTAAGEALYLIASLVGLAATAVEVGRPETAARLLGAADAQLRLTGAALIHINRLAYERAETTARAALGEAAFAAARTAGRDLDQEAWFAEADLVLAAAEDMAANSPRRIGETPAGLTPRETEILRLVAVGRSNREIASALFISVPTVKRHLTTILGKLGLPSRAEATAYARTHGLR